ncbi:MULTISPECIES: flagellar hook-associated protein FlgL [unclassified Shewanella]|uniref:flagellar hook-associated protein FlgL n=1 Tax=unclassified Shewanella TaxID=196818 RepID=UPI001BBF3C19|nr:MULTISPECIES: flagellar hook-associated protein FlgL [unclassified Shewanella]GIU09861.1 flagellar hook-associated protein FlgL [Shewanella sp. MBTL60-112-B1]GIU37423.1 flagellar hook-associated protein FlgL [Shewanella sp. MBTL60-112-B2]
MRISTAQMFHQTSSNVLKGQSATNQILEQLASGKKVNTAGDDPIAAAGIDNLNQQSALTNQFLKNIDYASNRLAVSESKIGSAETLIQSMHEGMLRSVNGTLTDTDRQAIADEMRSSLEELLSIANSKDESGNSLFAGFATDTTPFAFDNNGKVVYSGDSGVRDSIVASGVTVGSNIPGDSVFMNAANGLGDYSVNYSASQTGSFSVESAKVTDSALPVAGDYSFAFADDGAGGLELNVTDALGVVTTIPNFDPSQPVTVDGIELQFKGAPVAGDTFSMSPETQSNIFDTLNSAISLLEDGAKLNSPQGQSEMAQLLTNVTSGQEQMAMSRSVAGNSLKSLESYTDTHKEEQLVNQSALSLLEDLDYAEAITEFEKQQLALNAVSSVFSKVGSTSLFDYI